ncbi:MAG: D-2-hydroxyacid dehydrogenase [Eubacterium sp.]|nr:D-2-hydroxyacid dehydrogenase [Eubacterium sp.]
MKAVYLERNAVDDGTLSFEPITSQIETIFYDNTTEENKFEHIGDAEIIFSNKVTIDEETFKRCPNLKYIGVCATGYNVIDVEAARRHNVAVTNVPAYSTESVAQLAWGFILDCACHIGLHNDSVHRGDWVRSEVFCYWLKPIMELAGKTIGIVGYGNIGRRVAEIAKAFNLRVLVNTAHPEKYTAENTAAGAKAEQGGVSFVSLDELFRESDIVTLHCPMTKDTEGMICAENIAKMKDGVIIINVSRGGLVVEADLAEALKSGKVSSAAVDVVCEEPMNENTPLLTAPNIVITPHIGWAGLEARKRLINTLAENLRAFLEGRELNRV